MTATQLLLAAFEDVSKPGPVKFKWRDKSTGITATLAIPQAPVDRADESLVTAAAKGGAKPGAIVPAAMGGKQTQPFETVYGKAAAQLVRLARGIEEPEAEEETAEEETGTVPAAIAKRGANVSANGQPA